MTKYLYDQERGNRHERGYTNRWYKAAKRFLRMHPLCMADRCNKPSECVDHIEPHQGDMRKFWSRSNWQALCLSCHSRKTLNEQRAEHDTIDWPEWPEDAA